MTIFFTWIYNNTRGSLLLAILFHMASDLGMYLLNILSVPALYIINILVT